MTPKTLKALDRRWQQFLEELTEPMGRSERRQWARVYLEGLLRRRQLGVGTPRGLQGRRNRVLSYFWVPVDGPEKSLGTFWSPEGDLRRPMAVSPASCPETERGLKKAFPPRAASTTVL